MTDTRHEVWLPTLSRPGTVHGITKVYGRASDAVGFAVAPTGEFLVLFGTPGHTYFVQVAPEDADAWRAFFGHPPIGGAEAPMSATERDDKVFMLGVEAARDGLLRVIPDTEPNKNVRAYINVMSPMTLVGLWAQRGRPLS